MLDRHCQPIGFIHKETGRVCSGGPAGPGGRSGSGVLTATCSLHSLAGAQYWVYDGEKPVLGPAPISKLGLPESPVHAALVWGSEKNKIYFFRGGDYWRFHPSTQRVDSPVPRRVTDWRGVPPEIDAAFQDADGVLGLVGVGGMWVQQQHLTSGGGWVLMGSLAPTLEGPALRPVPSSLLVAS